MSDVFKIYSFKNYRQNVQCIKNWTKNMQKLMFAKHDTDLRCRKQCEISRYAQ